jgi:hypothetical protein
MLRAGLCVYPNLFPFLSSSPYEAVWRMAALCACILALETIVVVARAGWSRLAGVDLAATLAAALLAALAGRQATMGVPCYTEPFITPTPTMEQAVTASTNLLMLYQDLTAAACLVALVLLAVSVMSAARGGRARARSRGARARRHPVRPSARSG